MQPVMLVQLAPRSARFARPHDRAQALSQHQRAYDPEKDDIGQLDHQIDLTD